MSVAAIEFSKLFEVVWVSLLAGIGVTLVYSLVILGAARSSEARRDGRGSAALGFGVLAGLAFLLFGLGVVYGVQIILNK